MVESAEIETAHKQLSFQSCEIMYRGLPLLFILQVTNLCGDLGKRALKTRNCWSVMCSLHCIAVRVGKTSLQCFSTLQCIIKQSINRGDRKWSTGRCGD